eukprot:342270_1
MSTEEQLVPDFQVSPTGWIISTINCILGMIVHIWLLKKERKKRQSCNILWISKYIQYLPLIVMISGFLNILFTFFMCLPDFCYFGGMCFSITVAFQFVSLGYYQLSRLFYCFSESQIHSKIGYSKLTFIIMISIGFLVFIVGIIFIRNADLILNISIIMVLTKITKSQRRG